MKMIGDRFITKQVSKELQLLTVLLFIAPETVNKDYYIFLIKLIQMCADSSRERRKEEKDVEMKTCRHPTHLQDQTF